MSRLIVSIVDVHFNPDTRTLLGRAEDSEDTYFVLKMPEGQIKAMTEAVKQTRCPRCDFEQALCTLVYAGDFISEHYEPEEQGQLSDEERAIVDAGRAWAANDAVDRCLADD